MSVDCYPSLWMGMLASLVLGMAGDGKDDMHPSSAAAG
jgi:hypothetical protein